MSLEIALLLLPGLIVGLSLHEFAHAWSASLLGDNFARRQGRVSLNPARHLSILGTLAIFFLPIGWGKPVQVNLYNFKHPKRDYLITSLAGPLANVIVVICCIALAQLTRHDYSLGVWARRYVARVHYFLMFTASINTVLATINLLPIPPLDGSKIWPCLIPGLKPSFGAKGIWIFIIAIMFLAHTGALDPVLRFAVRSAFHYMPVPDSNMYEQYQQDGETAYDAGKLDLAEDCFSAALEFNPRAHDTLHWRAVIRTNLGKWSEALEDIDSAIALSNAVPYYSKTRAIIRDELARRDGAPGSQPASLPADAE